MKTTLSRRFVALFAAAATLAMATLIDASSSSQVEQLGLLAVPRTGHAATALADGRVLITGGRDSAGTIVATAEVFDPENQTSTAIGVLNTARINHTATLLANGRVLIAGGTGASGALTSAEIFDPANPGAGFRVLSATMGAARAGHTATRLHDGTVLIAGGDASGTAEIFKPTTESFSSTLLAMAAPRIGHTATLFSDDSVLLAGGNTDSMEYFSSLDQAFTLDPQKMTAARTGHDAISLSDARLLFFGGDTGHTIDELNSSADTLTLKATMDGAPSSATLLANGRILVLRPDAAGLYAPDATDQATAFTLFDEGSVPGSTALLRSGQTTTELSGDKKILVAGGQNPQHQPTLQIATFNPARIWTDKDDYLPDDPVFLFGSGWKASEDVYLFAVDSETEQWTYGSTATANAQGSFAVEPYFIVEMRHLGTTFNVSAVGAQSNMQADVEFTDAGSFGYSPSSQSLTIGDGSNNSFSQSVTDPKNNDALTAVPVVTGTGGGGNIALPTSWISTSPTSLGFPASGSDQTQSWSVTVTVPSGTAAGTYTGNIKAHATVTPPGTKTPNDGQGTDLTIVVPARATTLAVSSASGTYGGTSTSLSATLTLTSDGSPISGKTINFTLNGNSAGTATTNASGIATLASASLCGSGINAGSFPTGVGASFAAGGIYAAANGTASLTVGKANAAVVVTPYTVTYDGTAHTATVASITGVCGQTGATVGSVSVSGTTHTNANTYTDTWTFTPTANYNNITTGNTITDTINKATPTFSGLTASQTISCGTASISLTGKFSAGSGTSQVAPTGQTASISVDGAPVATSTGFSGNAGNFTATVNTGTIPGGTHPITYNYAGDSNFFPATDSSTTLTVNNCNVNTTTSVASSLNPSIYGQSVTFTATVTAASGSNPPTGSLNFVIAGIGTVAGTPGSTTSTTATWTYTTSALSAGTHTVSASYAHTGSFVDSSNSLLGGQVVNKANATFTVTPYDVTYDTFEHTASVSAITGVNGETGAAVGTVDVSNTKHTNAGTFASDTWSFTGTANYNNQGPTTITDKIGKADATFTVTPYDVTYDTFEHTASVSAITGVGGETGPAVGTVDVSNTAHTNAGTFASDTWSFTGTANYNNQGPTTITDKIGKADATFTVTPYDVTYDTFEHTASVSAITGVNGETGAAVGTVNVSDTAHTNAGTFASDTWSFTGTANYNNQGPTTITDKIGKADATFTVTPYDVTYDTFEHTASVSAITGVNGETGAAVGTVDVSNTAHTNAGTFASDTWSFTGTANYNNQGPTTITDKIGKADATFTVTPYDVTYDTFEHTASVSAITGVGGETGAGVGTVDVSNTKHTNAGTFASDTWSFTGTANYNNQGPTTITDKIGKADATFTVTPYDVTYDTFEHTASVSAITGVGGETGAAVGTVNVSDTAHTNAGTYASDTWSFTGTANYNNQGPTTITDKIGKADATIVVTPYTVTYDTFEHTATVTSITGVGGETGATVGTVNVSGTAHTNAGTYASDTWSFTGTANYNNQGPTTITDKIGKADATIVVTPYTVTYDTFSHTATVTSITGVGGETGATVGTVNVSGTAHTNAGTYSDSWSFTPTANYNPYSGSTAITDKINKADATIVVTPYTVTYDTFEHTATVTSITGVGGETGATVGTVNVSGTAHTNAGTYSDSWSFTPTANYNPYSGSTAITDKINKANATIVVAPYNVVYDYNAHTATITSITGVGGETGATVGTVNVSGTTHTPPGDYLHDPWTFTGTGNYNDTSGEVHDVISFGTCSGSGVILPPINSDGTSVYSRKGNSTIPVKFTVCDANGNPISNPAAVFGSNMGGTITLLSTVRGTVSPVNEEPNAINIPDVAFRYSGGQWIFNMAISNLTVGNTYTFRINLAYAPASITFRIGVK